MVVRELINLIGFKVDNKQLKDSQNKFAGIKTAAKRAALALGAAIIGIGTTAFKTAADMEALNTQFEVMTGSAEKAKALTSDLINFAKKTPFRLEDLSKGTKTLLQFGVTQEEIMPVLQNLGDIAGGSSEKLQTLALVFGQIKGLGKLQGQDWRQLVNAGFNPLESIAKKTGKTMAELQKEMSKGTITFDMFRDSLLDVTSEGGRFYKNMEKASQTVAGIFSTMRDAFSISLADAARQALPQLKKIMLATLPLLENEFGDLAKSIVSILVPILESVIKLIRPIMRLLLSVFKALMPILNTIAKVVNSTLVPMLDSILEILTPLLEDFGYILNEIYTTLEPILNIIITLLAMMIKNYLARLRIFFIFLKPYFKFLSTVLTPLFVVLEKIMRIIDVLMDSFNNLFYKIIGNAVDWVKKKIGSVGDTFKEMFSGIGNFFSKIINYIIDGINWLIKSTNKVAKTKIELIDRLDPSKILAKDITNNNQRQTNVNINNDIKVSGMQDRNQIKSSIEKTAGSVFNLELKKLLIEAGGL